MKTKSSTPPAPLPSAPLKTILENEKIFFSASFWFFYTFTVSWLMDLNMKHIALVKYSLKYLIQLNGMFYLIGHSGHKKFKVMQKFQEYLRKSWISFSLDSVSGYWHTYSYLQLYYLEFFYLNETSVSKV